MKTSILITVVVTGSHQDIETKVKSNKTFNLSFLVYNVELLHIIPTY